MYAVRFNLKGSSAKRYRYYTYYSSVIGNIEHGRRFYGYHNIEIAKISRLPTGGIVERFLYKIINYFERLDWEEYVSEHNWEEEDRDEM